MKMTRRGFLGRTGLLTAAGALHGAYAKHDNHLAGEPDKTLLDTSALTRYVDPLPIPPILKLSGQREGPVRIPMRQFQARVHRDVPPTTFWGYGGSWPGPTLEAHRGQPVRVEWVNELPQQHLLPVDHTLHGAEKDKPDVRTVVHLHGGRVPPDSDGYPESWFVPGRSATCHYPNQQEATTLFYHDHAMGITRLNAVAGLAGTYLVRDELEESLRLPRGAQEVPLVLCDRSFTRSGALHYPVSGKADTPWVSEYYGSAILVNGKIFPYLEVEARKYRFRVLNVSNGSFYKLSLGTADAVSAPAIEFAQIGSDQGFLVAPAAMSSLILGPGERADLVVDFAQYAGKSLFLRTDVTVFMQFRVSGSTTHDPDLPATLRPIARMPESAAVQTRELTIADYQDRLGRSSVMLLNGAHWDMPVTETPVLGSTETWSFVNLTDDSHPIHLHLVRFQVLDRRPFDLNVYQLTRKIVLTGPAVALPPGELGWKDTVRVDPMTVTRIIVKFEGFAGRYVWHCHMLEHEDNEMMRPYEIKPAGQ